MNLQLAQNFRDYPMHYNNEGWLVLAWFILLAAIAAAAIMAIAKYANKSSSSTEPRNPLEIAKERYAKGEISKEEYTDIKKELKAKD